jgi:hypothetical protein
MDEAKKQSWHPTTQGQVAFPQVRSRLSQDASLRHVALRGFQGKAGADHRRQPVEVNRQAPSHHSRENVARCTTVVRLATFNRMSRRDPLSRTAGVASFDFVSTATHHFVAPNSVATTYLSDKSCCTTVGTQTSRIRKSGTVSAH